MDIAKKLGLGGHSFISELGNDPAASFDEQCAIVSACLESGITLFDTTYYQERVALGNVLKRLGRRSEARILAWNFFRNPADDKVIQPYSPYEAHRIDEMLSELQTDVIDLLVIHVDDDRERQSRELELASRWIAEGKVREAALGMVRAKDVDLLPENHPVSYVLAPYNAFNQGSLDVFRKAADKGIRSIALSPFIRGYKLDEIGGDHARTADILLRWVCHQPIVESVIVSMRRADYVENNLNAVRKGPLNAEEEAMLQGWIDRLG
ncbi:aldo/keto reductase [Paenibacillus humicola]|uniref:aldo/keto reductase n=1 Tax=Paenibacillus humicola TaxID=3110540 RepID=UPI00237A5082|nr:aldo/keto reductase [Paenibacillus humicola]